MPLTSKNLNLHALNYDRKNASVSRFYSLMNERNGFLPFRECNKFAENFLVRLRKLMFFKCRKSAISSNVRLILIGQSYSSKTDFIIIFRCNVE